MVVGLESDHLEPRAESGAVAVALEAWRVEPPARRRRHERQPRRAIETTRDALRTSGDGERGQRLGRGVLEFLAPVHDRGGGLGVEVHDHTRAATMQVQDATGRDGRARCWAVPPR